MKTIQEPITGNESVSSRETPYEVLVEFYNAFNNGRLPLMEDNWSNSSDQIVMDNPLGGIMRGWTEIRSVYRRIFEGKAKVYVEYYDYTIHQTGPIFYTVGRERGHFRTDDQKIELAIRTSRIYQKIENEWKQVHHHGSIEDPGLLNRYQELVKK